MRSSPIKTWDKQLLKKVASILNHFYPGRKSKSRILTYHSVGNRDHEMNVTTEAFAEQMRWLSENDNVITVSEAAQGNPGIAITFDDGYLDNLQNAAPILSEFGFPATVYMVSGRAGETLEHDSDVANAQLMNWDELRELEALGISIGGHTLTHARLSTLSSKEQMYEIDECTKLLEKKLGHSIESFAYPYGSALDYSKESVLCVQRAGYSVGVSNRYGSVQPSSSVWELPRIWIDRTDTLGTFAQKASGKLDILALQDSYMGIRARRVINTILRVK